MQSSLKKSKHCFIIYLINEEEADRADKADRDKRNNNRVSGRVIHDENSHQNNEKVNKECDKGPNTFIPPTQAISANNTIASNTSTFIISPAFCG